MSLLQKASIITTPTAYAEDYLYSIKPAYALGENLDVIPSSDSAVGNHYKFSPYGNNTVQYVNGETIITYVDSNNGAFHYFRAAYNTTTDLTVGKKYKVEISFKINTGSFTWQYNDGTGSSYLSESSNTNFETISYNFIAGHTVNTWVRASGMGSGEVVTVKKITLQEITDADFDFDRNSTGTRVNEDYLIEDVPYNFVINSEEFSSSNYTKSGVSVVSNDIIAPNGTLTADKIVEDTSNGAHQIYDAVLTNSGNFTNSIMVKAAGRTKIRVNSGSNSHRVDFDLSTATKSNEVGATGSIVSVSDGWYRCIVSWNNTTPAAQYLFIALLDNSGNTSYTGDGSSGVYIWGGQLVKGDQPKDYLKTTDRLDIPRIDYTNGEPSILLEPSRQNKITYSQDFSQWTVDGDASINSNNIISPEGIQNSDKLIAGTTSARQSIKLTSTNSGDLSFSIFAKKGEYSVIQLTDAQNASAFANFNLDTGAVGSTGVYTASMIDMHNDWYRCIITWNASVSIVAVRVGIVTTPTSARVEQFAGNGSDGLYIYGAQLEVGSYATSLIHTSGSAVTRSADAANNAGNSDLINSTEGVLYVEFKTPEPQPTAQYIAINDGAAGANQVRIGWLNFKIYIQIRAGGSAFYTYNPSLPTHTEFNKIAVKFKASDHAVYINGQEVDTSTASNIFSSNVLNTLSFSAYTTTGKFYGNVKSVMVFKEALTDLELEKLTGYNNHELYMNYYNRLSYLGLAEEYNVESDINNYIL